MTEAGTEALMNNGQIYVPADAPTHSQYPEIEAILAKFRDEIAYIETLERAVLKLYWDYDLGICEACGMSMDQAGNRLHAPDCIIPGLEAKYADDA